MPPLYETEMKRKLFAILMCCIALAANAVTLKQATTYITDRNYQQAITAFRSLMQQNTYARNADCNKYLGQALCMTGEYAESVKYLEYGARNGKNGAWWYLGISRQHLYDFDGAIEALEKYKTYCSKGSSWIARTDSIIAECKLCKLGATHVQDVVIIDSMLVSRKAFFTNYRLGAESGRMLSASQCGGAFARMADAADGSVFENQAADYRLFASATDGQYRLYESHLFAGEWSEPQVVASVNVGDRRMCFPFMRTDSETLFFACDSTPGFGGMDIYKTHYSTENEAFFTPERMGMPFNSPYNDYMMAIDESHQVGWWATDRNAPAGMVCIYMFSVDEVPTYLEGSNPDRARVSRLADTWKNAAGYTELVNRIKSAPQFAVVKENVRIPISDDVVYSDVSQFKSRQARDAYELSVRVESSLTTLRNELEAMRLEWRTANERRRKELRPLIMQSEKREVQLMEQLSFAQKKYKSIELR